MTSTGGGPLEFHNIQEIVDIKLMFELICMFVLFFVFLALIPNDQEKRKSTVKWEESSKLLLYYSAIVKYMCLFCDQLTSYLPIQVSK